MRAILTKDGLLPCSIRHAFHETDYRDSVVLLVGIACNSLAIGMVLQVGRILAAKNSEYTNFHDYLTESLKYPIASDLKAVEVSLTKTLAVVEYKSGKRIEFLGEDGIDSVRPPVELGSILTASLLAWFAVANAAWTA